MMIRRRPVRLTEGLRAVLAATEGGLWAEGAAPWRLGGRSVTSEVGILERRGLVGCAYWPDGSVVSITEAGRAALAIA